MQLDLGRVWYHKKDIKTLKQDIVEIEEMAEHLLTALHAHRLEEGKLEEKELELVKGHLIHLLAHVKASPEWKEEVERDIVKLVKDLEATLPAYLLDYGLDTLKHPEMTSLILKHWDEVYTMIKNKGRLNITPFFRDVLPLIFPYLKKIQRQTSKDFPAIMQELVDIICGLDYGGREVFFREEKKPFKMLMVLFSEHGMTWDEVIQIFKSTNHLNRERTATNALASDLELYLMWVKDKKITVEQLKQGFRFFCMSKKNAIVFNELTLYDKYMTPARWPHLLKIVSDCGKSHDKLWAFMHFLEDEKEIAGIDEFLASITELGKRYNLPDVMSTLDSIEHNLKDKNWAEKTKVRGDVIKALLDLAYHSVEHEYEKRGEQYLPYLTLNIVNNCKEPTLYDLLVLKIINIGEIIEAFLSLNEMSEYHSFGRSRHIGFFGYSIITGNLTLKEACDIIAKIEKAIGEYPAQDFFRNASLITWTFMFDAKLGWLPEFLKQTQSKKSMHELVDSFRYFNDGVRNNTLSLSQACEAMVSFWKHTDYAGRLHNIIDTFSDLLEIKHMEFKEGIKGVTHMLKELDRSTTLLGPFMMNWVKHTKERGHDITWESMCRDIPKIISKIPNEKFGAAEHTVNELHGLLYRREVTWEELVKLSEECPKVFRPLSAFSPHFSKLIPPIIDFERYRKPLLDYLEEIMKSRNDTKRMKHILTGLDDDTEPFFWYLVINRPGDLLRIFSRYSVMHTLKIDFYEEMALILKLAFPVTEKAERLEDLGYIFSPNPLSSYKKDKFMRSLDNASKRFTGSDSPVLGKIMMLGFSPDEQLSRTDMSYIFFRYTADGELDKKKTKKLKKKLNKLQNDEKKCLKLIEEKNRLDKLNDKDKKKSQKGLEMTSIKLQRTLEKISSVFFEPVLYLFNETSKNKVQQHMADNFGIEPKNLDEKLSNPSFFNALEIYSRLAEHLKVHTICKDLIAHILAEETYPYRKDPSDCYPFTLPENKKWLDAHVKNKKSSVWTDPRFTKTYSLSQESKQESNVEERVKHHKEQIIGIADKLRKLGVDIKIPDNLHSAIEDFGTEMTRLRQKFVKEKKLTEEIDNLLSDLKTQINGIISAIAEEKVVVKGRKVIIMQEFDPLEILQMGNYVSGSCLNTYGPRMRKVRSWEGCS
jgi:hypothetical protein